MNHAKSWFFLIPLFLLWIVSTNAYAQSKLKIAVGIAPEKYFIEQIAGEQAEITVMLPAGANPHVYEPSPRQLSALTSSRLYFAIGLPFEKIWLNKLRQQSPQLAVIELDQADSAGAPHGQLGSDSAFDPRHEANEDPHPWTNPLLVLEMADRITAALQRIDPDHGETYQRNNLLFKSALTTLDKDLHQLLDTLPHRQFIVQHPAWGHFAEAYGLNQISIEQGGREPGPQQLSQVIDIAKKNNIRTIFASPETDIRPARAVAQAVGGKVVILDPLREDYLHNLRDAGMAIAQALKGS
jgi:zinc transport system substrate-binding protein